MFWKAQMEMEMCSPKSKIGNRNKYVILFDVILLLLW